MNSPEKVSQSDVIEIDCLIMNVFNVKPSRPLHLRNLYQNKN